MRARLAVCRRHFEAWLQTSRARDDGSERARWWSARKHESDGFVQRQLPNTDPRCVLVLRDA